MHIYKDPWQRRASCPRQVSTSPVSQQLPSSWGTRPWVRQHPRTHPPESSSRKSLLTATLVMPFRLSTMSRSGVDCLDIFSSLLSVHVLGLSRFFNISQGVCIRIMLRVTEAINYSLCVQTILSASAVSFFDNCKSRTTYLYTFYCTFGRYIKCWHW